MKKVLFFISLIVVFNSFVSLLFAQDTVYIRDILGTPHRYYNLKVLIKGEIVDVEPATQIGQRGFYVVLDNSDKKIRVVANELPAPGKKFSIIGFVQIETSNQQPYIREINRIPFGESLPVATGSEKKVGGKEKQKIDPIIIGLGILILLVVIILMVVIFKKPRSASQPPQQAERSSTPKESTHSSPKKTKQVSPQEVIAKVGSSKTTQVPNILAQLVIASGDSAGKSFPLKYDTTIGREIGDIILNDNSISRKHATIHFEDEKYILENNSNVNPVVLNGEKVQVKKELKDKDEIICGLIKFQFKIL